MYRFIPDIHFSEALAIGICSISVGLPSCYLTSLRTPAERLSELEGASAMIRGSGTSTVPHSQARTEASQGGDGEQAVEGKGGGIGRGRGQSACVSWVCLEKID